MFVEEQEQKEEYQNIDEDDISYGKQTTSTVVPKKSKAKVINFKE